MPELNLGNKYECYSCGTRFYDLGKSEAVCPKCGANQKDSDRGESFSTSSQSARKKRKAEPAKPIEIEEEEVAVGGDIADDELDVGDVEIDAGLDDEEEEEDLDDED